MIGLRLRNLRESAFLTQAEVAAKMGVTKSRVSAIERAGDAQYSTVVAFAKACGYDVEFVNRPAGAGSTPEK